MSNASYNDIRRNVDRRYRGLSFFLFHVVVAMTASILWMTAGESGVGARVVAVLWSGVLVCHGLKVYLDDARDRTIERTWDQYAGADDVAGDLSARDEKSKRALWLDTDEYETPDEDPLVEIDFNQLPLWTR